MYEGIFNMKAYSIKLIKDEIVHLSQPELVKLCLLLAKSKKENKEYLSYLLFESEDEQRYVVSLKESLLQQFEEVNVKSVYLTKKSLRKIIRTAARFLKYTGNKESHVQIYLFLIHEILKLKLNLIKSLALQKIYTSLKNKLRNLIDELHEDLQFDYLSHFRKLD